MNRNDEKVEAAAQAVYELLPLTEGLSVKPVWVPGGNSLKQDESRRYARAALEAAMGVGPVIPDVDDARDLFEKWAVGRDLTPDTWGVSSYVSPYVDNDWCVWRVAFAAGATAAVTGSVLVNTGDSEAEFIRAGNEEAAREPVGQEPVAWLTGTCEIVTNEKMQADRASEGPLFGCLCKPLYAAPPTQPHEPKVDLGQFREAIESARWTAFERREDAKQTMMTDAANRFDAKVKECDRLLALIDSQGVG